jgi:hypothetical protein
MQLTRLGFWILLLLGLVLLSVSCGSASPGAEPQPLILTPETSSQAFDSPLSTATPILAMTPVSALVSEPTPTPFRLVVLHTNDNWGETEPCG